MRPLIQHSIDNPKEMFLPGDIIKGTYYIKNESDKLMKLKQAVIRFCQRWPTSQLKHASTKDRLGFQVLAKYILAEKESLEPGEAKTIEFEITLPTKIPNEDATGYELHFLAKTGLVIWGGSDMGGNIYRVPFPLGRIKKHKKAGLF